MTPLYLDDESYSRALSTMILVCTDALIVDEQEHPYVAYRLAKPMDKQWWFIGGRRRFGELPLKGMRRCFRRELALSLPAGRFTYIATYEYLFRERQQTPQALGTHTISDTFVVRLTKTELETAKRSLDSKEYSHERGLKRVYELDPRWDRDVHPFIIDCHERYLAFRKRRWC